MPDELWYAGVCDRMLQKVAWWAANWPRGDVFATRPYMSEQFELQNVVTMRRLKVPWTAAEFAHLIRILDAVKPAWTMTADLKAAAKGLSKCQLGPGGQHYLPMISYEQDAKDLLDLLLQVKAGQLGFSRRIDEQVKAGGKLWE